MNRLSEDSHRKQDSLIFPIIFLQILFQNIIMYIVQNICVDQAILRKTLKGNVFPLYGIKI